MEKKTQKEKIQELTERLEKGVKEVFESGAYENYLKVMSKFHRYSFRNTVLIWMQNPDATYVAGYEAWKNDFNRQVKKGEKGIRIFAPTEYKVKKQQQKIDKDTDLPMVDGMGQPVMETVEVKRRGYMATSVFDVSQTEGEELPELVKSLDSKVENYEAFVHAIEKISPVPILFEQIGVSDGYYSLKEEQIHIDEDLGPTQTILTMIHEIAHAKLHNAEMKNKEAEEGKVKDKQTREVEAESIAYVVCQRYGIETGDNSFGYIASWSKDKELPQLQASLQTISRTAYEMIKGMDKVLGELLSDKEKDSVLGHLDEQKGKMAERPADITKGRKTRNEELIA